ncbi:hypothetical protein TrVE_jg4107 [Triparma verrucosa]|uniref:Uncharacterized protein n=1 Tax=Triparma verrucosa TaxID=1606542 RepID=A0A9W7CCJ9_9STRA|nr:hypothetical protein TrVE_jg4107 [Triparma verrucosa]
MNDTLAQPPNTPGSTGCAKVTPKRDAAIPQRGVTVPEFLESFGPLICKLPNTSTRSCMSFWTNLIFPFIEKSGASLLSFGTSGDELDEENGLLVGDFHKSSLRLIDLEDLSFFERHAFENGGREFMELVVVQIDARLRRESVQKERENFARRAVARTIVSRLVNFESPEISLTSGTRSLGSRRSFSKAWMPSSDDKLKVPFHHVRRRRLK